MCCRACEEVLRERTRVEVVAGPSLGGLAQPGLGDLGERQPIRGWPKTARSQMSFPYSLSGDFSARAT